MKDTTAATERTLALGLGLLAGGIAGCQEPTEPYDELREVLGCSDADLVPDGIVDAQDLNAFSELYAQGDVGLDVLNVIGQFWQQPCGGPPPLFVDRDEIMAMAIPSLIDQAALEGHELDADHIEAMEDGDFGRYDFDPSRPVVEPSGAVRIPLDFDVSSIDEYADQYGEVGLARTRRYFEALLVHDLFNQYNPAHLEMLEHYLGTEDETFRSSNEGSCVTTCTFVGTRLVEDSSDKSRWTRDDSNTTPGSPSGAPSVYGPETVATGDSGAAWGVSAVERHCIDKVDVNLRCDFVPSVGSPSTACDGASVKVFGNNGAYASASSTVVTNASSIFAKSHVKSTATVAAWGQAARNGEELEYSELAAESTASRNGSNDCSEEGGLMAILGEHCRLELISSFEWGTNLGHKGSLRYKCNLSGIIEDVVDDLSDNFQVSQDGNGEITVVTDHGTAEVCENSNSYYPNQSPYYVVGAAIGLSFSDGASENPNDVQDEDAMLDFAKCSTAEECRDAAQVVRLRGLSTPLRVRNDGSGSGLVDLPQLEAEFEVFNTGEVNPDWKDQTFVSESLNHVRSYATYTKMLCAASGGAGAVPNICRSPGKPPNAEGARVPVDQGEGVVWPYGSDGIVTETFPRLNVSASCPNDKLTAELTQMHCVDAGNDWTRDGEEFGGQSVFPAECTPAPGD